MVAELGPISDWMTAGRSIPPYSSGVDSPRSRMRGLGLQRPQLVLGQAGFAETFTAQELGLQRSELTRDEPPDGVTDVALLVVELEVHPGHSRRGDDFLAPP